MDTIQHYLNSNIIDIIPLLSLVLKKEHAQLITNSHYKMTSSEKSYLNKLVKQRKNGIPFAYLSGVQGFYNLNFKVTPDTLIPRPETELLIDIALELFNQNDVCKALDLGTGSGIIAITLTDRRPNWKITATDYCLKALKVAKANTKNQINFQCGNWFEPVNNQTFDLVVSNPPYIETQNPCLEALSYEPKQALIAGQDGLDAIKTIINHTPNYLKQSGYLLLEHGHNQKTKIIKLLENNFCNIRTFKDYNGKDRAILTQLKFN